jgi:hypothetical protein
MSSSKSEAGFAARGAGGAGPRKACSWHELLRAPRRARRGRLCSGKRRDGGWRSSAQKWRREEAARRGLEARARGRNPARRRPTSPNSSQRTAAPPPRAAGASQSLAGYMERERARAHAPAAARALVFPLSARTHRAGGGRPNFVSNPFPVACRRQGGRKGEMGCDGRAKRKRTRPRAGPSAPRARHAARRRRRCGRCWSGDAERHPPAAPRPAAGAGSPRSRRIIGSSQARAAASAGAARA